jgi:hypothetical protein
MKKTKTFLVAIVTIILIFVFTSPFLSLLEKITVRGGGLGSFIMSGRDYLSGFFISYSFFVTLVMTIFGGKKKYPILAILLLIIFLIQLGSLESLIVSIGAALVAWLIAQGILIIKKKVSKK